MTEELKPGLTRTERITIDRERTIGFLGDECRVYATPWLVYDVEMVCRNLLLSCIGPGKDSVGTRVEIDHLAATLMGMWAEITVTVADVKGPAVTFEVSARDGVEPIAKGRHGRFVVSIDRTAERMKAKQAKAAEASAYA
jgi:fluoroacetyl-CoA thioesterase